MLLLSLLYADNYADNERRGLSRRCGPCRAVDRQTGQEVAVKILSKQRRKSTREKTLRKIAREAACLAAVQVQGAALHGTRFCAFAGERCLGLQLWALGLTAAAARRSAIAWWA